MEKTSNVIDEMKKQVLSGAKNSQSIAALLLDFLEVLPKDEISIDETDHITEYQEFEELIGSDYTYYTFC